VEVQLNGPQVADARLVYEGELSNLDGKACDRDSNARIRMGVSQ